MKAGGEIRERNQVTFDKDNLRLEMLDVKRKLLKKSVAFVFIVGVRDEILKLL